MRRAQITYKCGNFKIWRNLKSINSMDNLTVNERESLEKLLTEYVDFLEGNNLAVQPSTERTNIELILERENNRYLLLNSL